MAPVEMVQDRVRIGQGHLAVLDDGNLPEGVAAQELGAALLALAPIDPDRLERQPEQGESEPHAVRVAGKGRTVDLVGLDGAGWDHVLLLLRWIDSGLLRFLE
jgi:hypothetical protein